MVAANSNRVKHKNKRWEIRRRDNIIFENIYIFRETLACMHGTSRLTVTKVLQVAAIYILKRFLSERLCASCVQLRNHPVQKIYAAMQKRNLTPFVFHGKVESLLNMTVVVFNCFFLVFQTRVTRSCQRFSNLGENQVYKTSSSLQLIGGWTPSGRKDPCCLNGFPLFTKQKKRFRKREVC